MPTGGPRSCAGRPAARGPKPRSAGGDQHDGEDGARIRTSQSKETPGSARRRPRRHREPARHDHRPGGADEAAGRGRQSRGSSGHGGGLVRVIRERAVSEVGDAGRGMTGDRLADEEQRGEQRGGGERIQAAGGEGGLLARRPIDPDRQIEDLEIGRLVTRARSRRNCGIQPARPQPEQGVRDLRAVRIAGGFDHTAGIALHHARRHEERVGEPARNEEPTTRRWAAAR